MMAALQIVSTAFHLTFLMPLIKPRMGGRCLGPRLTHDLIHNWSNVGSTIPVLKGQCAIDLPDICVEGRAGALQRQHQRGSRLSKQIKYGSWLIYNTINTPFYYCTNGFNWHTCVFLIITPSWGSLITLMLGHVTLAAVCRGDITCLRTSQSESIYRPHWVVIIATRILLSQVFTNKHIYI